MKVEIISHPSGDQLPMLVDRDGLPIPSPNEFVLSRRSLATNTLARNLRELSIFFLWLEANNIDLRARIKSSRTFTEAEVVGGMVEALRRGQGRGKKVRKLTVSPHTFNQRLTTLRQYMAWHFDVEIGLMPTAGQEYERLVPQEIITREGHRVDISRDDWNLPYVSMPSTLLRLGKISNEKIRWALKAYLVHVIERVHEAARAGIGLALLTEWYVIDDLATGRLIRVLSDWTPPFPGLALYYPAGRYVPAGLRAFIDLIKEINGRPSDNMDIGNP